jgi:hypothetical protein
VAAGPHSSDEQEDDFDLVATRSSPSGTLLTPGGQHPWTEPEALLGSLLGDRYSLVRLIGQGGMGAVYQAHHVVIGKTIAVKVLSPDYSRNPGDVQRFLQEARAASLIRHDHVVDIADFGYTAHGQAYLVMEYLEGEDLAQTASQCGRMGWFRVSNIAMQIGSALAAAHAKGIVHRDMKPENCFRVKRDGEADFIKVLDFGIAKMVDNSNNPLKKPGLSLTIEGGVIGTPEYIAPELCRGQKADARVDIYALGIIMYRLLTGVVPFTAENGNYMAVLSQHLTAPPRPPRELVPDIPPKIEQIILRALEKDPDQRYQKIEELIAALRDAQLTLTGASSTGLLTAARAIPRTRKVKAPTGMPLPLLITLGALLLIGGAAIVWALVGGRQIADDSDLPPVTFAQKTEPEPPARPPPVAPVITPTTGPGDSSDDGADTTGDPDPDQGPTPGRLPETLSSADFRRSVANIQKSLQTKCPGLPGMSVGARVQVEADGKVSRAVPEGSQAGSSFSTCVIKQIRQTRFKKAQKGSTHTATFKF